MVENTSGWGEEFELKKAASSGQNVRGSGEDVREGDVILSAGTEVGPPRDSPGCDAGLRGGCLSTGAPKW